jgi:hypothetical protein
MKKAIFLTFFLFCELHLIAQVSFSSTYQEYCIWLEDSKEFGDCRGSEESSFL